MNHIVVFDPNIFLWEENSFEMNPEKFSDLSVELMEIIEIVENYNVKIYFSIFFQEELENYYPAIDETSDVSKAIYRFLAKINHNIVSYPDFKYQSINSDPLIINYLFDIDVREEVKTLLSALYNYDTKNEDDKELLFVSAESIWNSSNDCLKIILGEEEKDIVTKINAVHINDFLMRSKRKYEMNPKHEPESGWGSPFHPPKEVAKKMLFDSIVGEKGNSQALFLYDPTRKLFIVFRPHVDDLYHAYENDKPSDIPAEVRKFFAEKFPSVDSRKIKKGKMVK